MGQTIKYIIKYTVSSDDDNINNANSFKNYTLNFFLS